MNFFKKFFNVDLVHKDESKEKSVKVTTQKKLQNSKYSGRQRTYQGPLFAQPGEISELFGYANFNLGRNLSAPFSIIDVETSHLSPNSGHIIEIAILQIDTVGKKIK